MGRVVEYAEHGYDGIVNIIPFGCMPGTIVSLLLHQFRQDYGLPVLNVVVEISTLAGKACLKQTTSGILTLRR